MNKKDSPTRQQLLAQIAELENELNVYKSNEKILPNEEGFWSMVAENMVDGAVIVNDKGNNIYTNEVAKKILTDIDPELLNCRYDTEAWDALDSNGNSYPLEKLPLSIALSENLTVSGFKYGISSNGVIKNIAINASPLYDRHYALKGAMASIRSEVVENETGKGFNGKTSIFDKVSHKAFDLVSICGLDGTFKYVSDSHRQLGYEPAELKGCQINDNVHPDDMGSVMQRVSAAIEKQTPGKIQYRYKLKQGGYVWLETQGRFICNRKGVPVLLLFISRDINEPREIENLLKQNERKYRNLADNISLGIYATSKEGVFLSANRAMLEMFGCQSESELTGMPAWKLAVESKQEETRNKFIEKAINQDITPVQVECKRKDGSTFYAKIQLNSDPEIPYQFGTVIDITDSMNAEKALRDSEEKYRMIVENSPDAIMLFKYDKLVSLTSRFSETTGYSLEDLPNRSKSDFIGFIHPDDRPQFLSKYQDDINNQVSNVKYTYRFRKKDGNSLWVSHYAERKFDNNGKPKVSVVITRDISEQKYAQNELSRRLQYEQTISKASTALLQSVENSLVLAMHHLLEGSNASRIYIFENYQNDEGALLMRQTHEVCASGVEPQIDNPVLQAVSYEKDGFLRWKTILEKNDIVMGSIDDFPFDEQQILAPQGIHSILIIPIMVASEWFGFIGFDYVKEEHNYTSSDLSLLPTFAEIIGIYLENKMNEDIIRKRNIELKETNATKDRLFSIIGHDLKNPINNILGFTSLMARNFDAGQAEKNIKYNDLVMQSIQNISSILENLLTWSRSQRNKISYDPLELLIQTSVQDCFTFLKPSADKKSIILENNIPKDLMVYGDFQMLNIVVRNLVSNAIKFTGENGKITASAQQDSKVVTIGIKDTGIGIPGDKISKLFSLDEKYSRQGTHGEDGTGLGLIICKEFIERHQGQIWVESEEGKGSTFNFALPRISP